MAKVLIIDDNDHVCKLLSGLIHQLGYDAVYKHNIEAGLKEMLSNSYEVVLLDVHLPDGNGLDIIPKIRKTPFSPEVIIITGLGNEDGAERAIEKGAWDYILKTDSPKNMILPLQRVLQYREELQKSKKISVPLKFDRIIGKSLRMKDCFEMLAQFASSDANVLLTGETGTGKELFTRAIHENSSRSDNRLVVVDCAALPKTLVESTLFGHVKGAFTGADRIQEGLVKHADGGTLFLDEVGELPLSVQKSFLRVLQERRFRPVGGKNEIDSDFRVIAATNRNLNDMVKSGKFRRDLLYRLMVLTINLPPLRKRAEDIMDLGLFYIKKFCERNKLNSKGFSPEFLEALMNYKWPGNVRELINVLETAFTAAINDPTLLTIHLPMHIRIHSVRASVANQTQDTTDSEKNESISATIPSFREVIESTEHKYFQDLVCHTKGDIKESCKISGLSRSRLYGLMKKHSISRNSKALSVL